ncbi:MAG: MFS transporter [Actinobacteria bacterium]|nr:MFS transporter [Actinomycetota bacterium]
MEDGTTPPESDEREHPLTRAMILLFLLTALMSLGYGSVFTLLADIRDKFGFTDGQVGLIAFAGLFTGVLSQLFLARYSDRGYAVIMMRVGIATAAFGMLWMVFATSLWQWIAARLLLGLGSGMVGPAIRRVIIARDPQRVGANLGRQTAFDVAGFVLGPALAAGLAQLFGLRAPFIVLTVVYVLAVFLVGKVTTAADAAASEISTAKRFSLIRLPAMQSALFAAIAFYLTIGMFEALWSILLRDQGAATWLIGVTLSLFTIPMIVFAPKGGALAQRIGPIRVVTVSITVAAIATGLYGFVPLWFLIVISGFHAIADAYTMPANQVAVAVSTPPDQLAAGQGLLGATGLAIAAASALIGSAVYDVYGRGSIFAGTAVLMMVCLGLARWRWNAQPALHDITG